MIRSRKDKNKGRFRKPRASFLFSDTFRRLIKKPDLRMPGPRIHNSRRLLGLMIFALKSLLICVVINNLPPSMMFPIAFIAIENKFYKTFNTSEEFLWDTITEKN